MVMVLFTSNWIVSKYRKNRFLKGPIFDMLLQPSLKVNYKILYLLSGKSIWEITPNTFTPDFKTFSTIL